MLQLKDGSFSEVEKEERKTNPRRDFMVPFSFFAMKENNLQYESKRNGNKQRVE
jgi:hypothetical protein